jgi:hypothetical protein
VQKKHGRNANRSKLNPRVGLVRFDTSQSGFVEIYYDGAMKDKELIVTNPTPIPFRVEITNGEEGATIGDALDLVNKAFSEWITPIKKLKVLDDNGPESDALRSILFDG